MKTNDFSIRKSVSAILIAFTLSCFSSAANATIFYISTTGNDVTGTGSKGNPWKTLFKAASTVATAGDIIHVNAGTYIETATSHLPVGVSIEGDGVLSIIKANFSTPNTPILVATSPEGTNGNQHISNMLWEGQLSTTWGIEIKGRSNFSIHDCTIQNFAQRGVMWSGRNDNSAAPPSIYATGNTFYNNIITNCATYTGGIGYGCIMIGGQDGFLLYNSTLTQTGRASGTNGWPIKYANDGYLKGCKIYGNTVTKEHFDGTTFDFAFELFNVSGLEIYSNTIQGSIDLNYQPKLTYAYSVYIHDNNIGYNSLQTQIERGIVLEFDCETIWIKNNHFKNIYNPIYYSTRNLTKITNNVISNNLMEGIGVVNGAQGYGIRFISDGSANFNLSDFKVYNNTITGNYYQTISIVDAASMALIDIKNNTIQGYTHSWLFLDSGAGARTLTWFNNNIYNDLNATWGTNPRYVGGNPSNETNGNTSHLNPLFVGGGNYSLQAASPLIDAGINVGLPYIGMAPDKGYAEAGAILPINLLDLTVTDNKGKNLLQWKTASEINSDYFTIEHSTDGINFETAGTVKAAGYSSSEMTYSFTDANPVAGINYYRLVMVDKDKSRDISNVVTITTKKNQAANFASVQLSAGRNTLSIAINAAQSEKALLILFDANGRVLLNSPVTLQAGLNRLDKSTGTIAKGIYYVKLATASEAVVKNVMATE